MHVLIAVLQSWTERDEPLVHAFETLLARARSSGAAAALEYVQRRCCSMLLESEGEAALVLLLVDCMRGRAGGLRRAGRRSFERTFCFSELAGISGNGAGDQVDRARRGSHGEGERRPISGPARRDASLEPLDEEVRGVPGAWSARWTGAQSGSQAAARSKQTTLCVPPPSSTLEEGP